MTSGGDARDAEWSESPRPFIDRPPAAGSGPGPGGAKRGSVPEETEPDPGTVRPYLLTGGRTASRRQVNIETMVSLTGAAPAEPLDDIQQAVLRLAREPMAVAELAAYLAVPIGVAMVLVGDLAEAGLVRLNDASGGGSQEPVDDATLIRKVVNGVLKLRDAERR